MNKPGVIVTLVAILVGCIGVCIAGQSLILLGIVPVTFGPLLVSLACAFGMPKRSCQTTLWIGSLLYLAWITFITLSTFLLDPDPLSPVALIIAPIYSLPIMLLFWFGATLQHYSGEPTTLPTPAEQNE